MALNTKSTSLVQALNGANPQTLADALRQLQIGSFLRSMPTHLRRVDMTKQAANSYVLATLQAITLPDDAKACTIVRATAMAGTATAVELTVDAFGTTPGTGHIAVAPNGDIVTLAADAWTSVDVVYIPEKHDAAELTLSVATNVATLPTGTGQALSAGVILLTEAEALVGTSTGKKIILIPGSGAPAAGQAKLNLAKGTVTFAGADAVTSARLKFAMVPGALTGGVDANALLEAASNIVP